MAKSTMSHLSYGIEKPFDLLQKLTLDASKLTAAPHPHDVFNFVVTAAVLNEWIIKCYAADPLVIAMAKAKEEMDISHFPLEAVNWIADRSCLPNLSCDVRRHIVNAMTICWDTANASKHYHWKSSSEVTAIETDPAIRNWYQYFFTSRAPDLYIEYGGEHYGLSQLRGILVQFYTGLLDHIEGGNENATPSEA